MTSRSKIKSRIEEDGKMRIRFVALAIPAVLLFSSLAFADCEPNWKPGQGIPGINENVNAVTRWDPDGNGPQPELLIAGGQFSFAGDIGANNIAAWDGNRWQPLGGGINYVVLALTVYNGKLIVGGDFSKAGDVDANNIACWDGNNWQALGGGMNDYVRALTVYNGELIAGGACWRSKRQLHRPLGR